MKKLLSTITLLGALSGAAYAAPYYTAAPAPGALTSYDSQPVYTIELVQSFGAKSGDCDTTGVRGSFNLYSDAHEEFRHQFNLSVAPQWGNDDVKGNNGIVSADFFRMPLTAGYDLNIELKDNIFLYLGGKAGYAWATQEGGGLSESGGGFTWSIGAGVKVQCSDSIYVQAGYEFGRTHFSKGDFKNVYGAHTVSFGVGCKF